jgi:hypothetical protein
MSFKAIKLVKATSRTVNYQKRKSLTNRGVLYRSSARVYYRTSAGNALLGTLDVPAEGAIREGG